jgi:hypothetical protein
LISDTVHHEGEDTEESMISEVLVINYVKLNEKSACEARSSNLESWETSQHLPEETGKPRTPTGA